MSNAPHLVLEFGLLLLQLVDLFDPDVALAQLVHEEAKLSRDFFQEQYHPVVRMNLQVCLSMNVTLLRIRQHERREFKFVHRIRKI